MSEPLKVLNTDEIQKLLSVLKSKLPESCVAHSFIELQSRWKEEIKEQYCDVFCPIDDLYSGNVLAIHYGLAVGGMAMGTFYCNNNDEEKFKESLLKTKLIPWDNIYLINGVLDKNYPLIQDIFKAKNIDILDLLPAHMLYMDAENAKKYPKAIIPEGVRIGPLELKHLDIVCDNWPHYDKRIRNVLANDILRNLTSGVFVKEGQDGKEELAAMASQTDYGGVGRLQTVPKYRRKGYGLLALADLTRKMGEAGISPHLHIVADNFASKELFKKTPYKPLCDTYWVVRKE